MGLYLCIFEDNEELDGVEIGAYNDFNFFRDAVVAVVENGQRGTVCPVLITHSDCDGEWSSDQAVQLLLELDMIEKKFSIAPSVEYNSPWKKILAKSLGISPKNLLDCFFDVDGEPLLWRLRGLAEISVQKRLPILFQ